jgi:HTH-type transcriptional regulator/antitoxin HigA
MSQYPRRPMEVWIRIASLSSESWNLRRITMIDRIQNEYLPDVVTRPGETIQEALDAIGMSKAELADRMGKTPKFVIDIIKHGATITPITAMELEKVLGIPASFWNSRERRYRENLARSEEKKRLRGEAERLKNFPVAEMIKSRWIKKHKDKADQVDEILKFFGVASSKQWEGIWLSPSAAYRKSAAFASRPEACSVWLRKGELQAQELLCKPFHKENFISVLKEIRVLTRTAPETFEARTVQMCAETGVAVVFTPPIKGAPLYGATRWLTQEKALVQLSVRGRFEDLLWFTFFHEAGHILVHGKKEVFIEGKDQQNEKEKEADRFATSLLVPNGTWNSFKSSRDYRSAAAVKAFSDELGISPAIIVGRLQHERLIPFSHLNGLRRRFVIDAGA